MVNKYRDKWFPGKITALLNGNVTIQWDEDESYSDIPIEITRDSKKFKIIQEAALVKTNVIPVLVPAF